jgi:ribosomal protein S12 methylthiotransferase accessory factor
MRVTFPGGMKVDAQYRGFTIKTDQPVYAGGDGSAPAPFDLFLASIATCAGFYVAAFCQNRGIPAEKASLLMSTEKNPQTKMIDKIILEIHLPQEFPEKYQKAVIRSVHSCTVEAHIQKAPTFEITTKIDG